MSDEFKPHYNKTSKSWVEFYQHCELDINATHEAGHEIYRDIDMALMVSKNGTRKVPVKAKEKHIKKFPRAWEAYQNRRELQKTHLSVLGLRPSQIKDLERFEVTCLEDFGSKEVPTSYLLFQGAATQIIQLRDQNDIIQSGERVHQERQEVPGTANGQQYDNNQRGSKEENHKEVVAGLTYSFNL